MLIGLEPERASRHFPSKSWAREVICTPSLPSSVITMRSAVQVASTASNFSDLVWMDRDIRSKKQRKAEVLCDPFLKKEGGDTPASFLKGTWENEQFGPAVLFSKTATRVGRFPL